MNIKHFVSLCRQYQRTTVIKSHLFYQEQENIISHVKKPIVTKVGQCMSKLIERKSRIKKIEEPNQLKPENEVGQKITRRRLNNDI